nr:MAG TPA: hypothetical protein [Caudoviricetes sp.]
MLPNKINRLLVGRLLSNARRRFIFDYFVTLLVSGCF